MTDTMTAARTAAVTIRGYRPSDHHDCRRLWAELVRHRDDLYGETDPDADAGAGFEEYLTQLNLSGMWVAEAGRAGVTGFVGLMLDGRTGEVDPVVVAESHRGQGVGRALLDKVVEEARRRGLRRLTISPSVRDLAALHSLHTAGFGTVATVTLAYDLAGTGRAGSASGGTRARGRSSGGARNHNGQPGLDLYDLRFDV